MATLGMEESGGHCREMALVEVWLSLKAKIICCVGFELAGQHGGVSLYGLRGASATLKCLPSL